MSLRYRFIQTEDWLTGVNLVLHHPEFGPQYSGDGGHYRRYGAVASVPMPLKSSRNQETVRSAPSGRDI
jgi:hypothetical protein